MDSKEKGLTLYRLKKQKVLPPRKKLDAEFDLEGIPVSDAIMNGDCYELRRDREDLYERIARTVNIDYDPKQLKPFLKMLVKKDSVGKIKPLGLANERNFPADLRTRFQFMLSPMAQDDPAMFAIMGGNSTKKASSSLVNL